jgi:hypothetical protein
MTGTVCPYSRQAQLAAQQPPSIATNEENPDAVATSCPNRDKIHLNTARRAFIVLWWENSGIQGEISKIQTHSSLMYLEIMCRLFRESFEQFELDNPRVQYDTSRDIPSDLMRGVDTAIRVISSLIPVIKTKTIGCTEESIEAAFFNAYSIISVLANQHAAHFGAQFGKLTRSDNPARIYWQRNFHPDYFVFDPATNKLDFSPSLKQEDQTMHFTLETPNVRTGCPALPILRELWSLISGPLSRLK